MTFFFVTALSIHGVRILAASSDDVGPRPKRKWLLVASSECAKSYNVTVRMCGNPVTLVEGSDTFGQQYRN